MPFRVMPLALGLILAACHTGPISYTAATPRPLEDAYSCSLRKLNELGYTVSNTNKESGFVTGTKQTSGLGTRILTGSEYHDQLTVSIFDETGGTRRIRATAGRVDRREGLFGGTSTKSVKPSSNGTNDANALLAACGSGAVIQQGFAFETASADKVMRSR